MRIFTSRRCDLNPRGVGVASNRCRFQPRPSERRGGIEPMRISTKGVIDAYFYIEVMWASTLEVSRRHRIDVDFNLGDIASKIHLICSLCGEFTLSNTSVHYIWIFLYHFRYKPAWGVNAEAAIFGRPASCTRTYRDCPQQLRFGLGNAVQTKMVEH